MNTFYDHCKNIQPKQMKCNYKKNIAQVAIYVQPCYKL